MPVSSNPIPHSLCHTRAYKKNFFKRVGQSQRLIIINLDVNLFGLPEVVHSHMGVEPGPVRDALHMPNAWMKVNCVQSKTD